MDSSQDIVHIFLIKMVVLTSLLSKVQGLLGRVGPLEGGVIVFLYTAGQGHHPAHCYRLILGHWLEGVFIWATGQRDMRSY